MATERRGGHPSRRRYHNGDPASPQRADCGRPGVAPTSRLKRGRRRPHLGKNWRRQSSDTARASRRSLLSGRSRAVPAPRSVIAVDSSIACAERAFGVLPSTRCASDPAGWSHDATYHANRQALPRQVGEILRHRAGCQRPPPPVARRCSAGGRQLPGVQTFRSSRARGQIYKRPIVTAPVHRIPRATENVWRGRSVGFAVARISAFGRALRRSPLQLDPTSYVRHADTPGPMKPAKVGASPGIIRRSSTRRHQAGFAQLNYRTTLNQ